MTIPVAPLIKAVTVSPSSVIFACDGPGGQLQMGGTCFGGNPLVVNSGTGPELISVQGADAVPSDGGAHWTLVCEALLGIINPGVDQYELYTGGSLFGGNYCLANTATPDKNIGNGGVLPPGGSVYEELQLVAPSSSTDLSPVFTTTITWIAS